MSQLGWLFPIYGKIKNVPNHQSDNNSLTWIKAIKGDDFPNPNYDFQASLEQWARDEIYPDNIPHIMGLSENRVYSQL